MSKNTANTTTAERTGRCLGRMWRGYVRRETRAIRWLSSNGLPTAAGRLLVWIVKLTVFGLLLYAVFWIALAFAVLVVAAWVARNSGEDNEDKSEWREGHSGFGLYDRNEWRRDMGNSDERS